MNKKEIIDEKWIQAIGKVAYSEIMDSIDPNGWVVGKKAKQIPIQLLFMMDSRFNEKELRPKTLNRIEDNFGWNKPLEDGLPKRSGSYIFLSANKVQHPVEIKIPLSKHEENHFLNDFTHYKLQKPEPLPLH